MCGIIKRYNQIDYHKDLVVLPYVDTVDAEKHYGNCQIELGC